MIVRTAGLVGLAAVALVLAACSSTGAESDGSPEAKPQAPASTADESAAKPKVSNPFQSKGFTIRYLDQGKVKKIDVPDFKH